MNTMKKALGDIKEFLNSDDRCMLITGTHQFKKHLLVMAAIDQTYNNARVLFRVNAMDMLANRDFLGGFIKNQPKAWERFKIDNNYYYADSFTQRRTWHNDHDIDFAINYPIDAIAREEVKLDCVDDLFQNRSIKKIFLVSWTDAGKSYDIFNKYVNRSTIYDAEEEDVAYHKRVLEFDKRS